MRTEIKELQALDYDFMKQVDRAEEVAFVYEGRPFSDGLGLVLERIKQEPVLTIPSWSDEGIRKRIAKWQPEIDNGGCLLAAEQGGKIIGFGLIGPKREDGSVELCALFIGSEARQLGTGTILFRQLETKAKEHGAHSLLIYGNPTDSSVAFYLKQGCEIIGLADKRLIAHLPWDVVFGKSLG